MNKNITQLIHSNLKEINSYILIRIYSIYSLSKFPSSNIASVS